MQWWKNLLVVVVAVVFGGAMTVKAQELQGGSNSSRYQANASVSGDILVQSWNSSFWTQAAANPVPGNIGQWQASMNVSGLWLKNASPGDIAFALQYPQHSNANEDVGNLRWKEDPNFGKYISFDPVLQLSLQGNSQLYDNGGGGKGFAETVPPVSQFWGNANVSLNLTGGSVTEADVYLQRIGSMDPGISGFSDWTANFNFSGIIEASSFRIVGVNVPEPATALALMPGLLVWHRRRYH